MYEHRIRPADKHLMQADREYCYMDCSIAYETQSATVHISIFGLEHYQDEVRRAVSEFDLRRLVAEYEAAGWEHLHVEHGREYEGHYFQRQKGA